MTEILILGTGALATLFAARLSAAGSAVTMLGTWPEGLAALRQEGARLLGADGRITAHPVRAAGRVEDCRGLQHALVLVKAWQTGRAAAQLAACLPPDGLAVSLQNGLGNHELLVQELGADRVARGGTTCGAALAAPGLARPGGEGTVWLEAHPRLGGLESALRVAGFHLQVTAEAESLLWGKLVVNAAINPLTALLRLPNGELLERPAARRLMGELAGEAAAVAAALGVRLPFAHPQEATEEVARQTAGNRSSMLQDVERGAPTEVDAICGAVVRLGEQAGVRTPANRILWSLIVSLNEKHPLVLRKR